MPLSRLIDVFDSEAAEAQSGLGNWPFTPPLAGDLRYQIRTTAPAARGAKEVGIDVYAGDRSSHVPDSSVGLNVAAGARLDIEGDAYTLAEALRWKLPTLDEGPTIMWDPANALGHGAVGNILTGPTWTFVSYFDPTAAGLRRPLSSYQPRLPSRPRPSDETLAKFVKIPFDSGPAPLKTIIDSGKTNYQYEVVDTHPLFEKFSQKRVVEWEFAHGLPSGAEATDLDQPRRLRNYFWGDGSDLSMGAGDGFGIPGHLRVRPLLFYKHPQVFWHDPDSFDEYWALSDYWEVDWNPGSINGWFLPIPPSVSRTTLRFTEAAKLRRFNGENVEADVEFEIGDPYPLYDPMSHSVLEDRNPTGLFNYHFAPSTPSARPMFRGCENLYEYGLSTFPPPLVGTFAELMRIPTELRQLLFDHFDAFNPILAAPLGQSRVYAVRVQGGETTADPIISGSIPDTPNTRYNPSGPVESGKLRYEGPVRTVTNGDTTFDPYNTEFADPYDVRKVWPALQERPYGEVWRQGIEYIIPRGSTSSYGSAYKFKDDLLFDAADFLHGVDYIRLTLPFVGASVEVEPEDPNEPVDGPVEGIDGPVIFPSGVREAIFPTVRDRGFLISLDIRESYALIAIPQVGTAVPTARTLKIEEGFSRVHPSGSLVSLVELIREAVGGADRIWADELGIEADETVVTSYAPLTGPNAPLGRREVIQRDISQRVRYRVAAQAPVSVGRLIRDALGRVWRITGVDRSTGAFWEITATRRLAGPRQPSPYGYYPESHHVQRSR